MYGAEAGPPFQRLDLREFHIPEISRRERNR
jgi:hypothetical protein